MATRILHLEEVDSTQDVARREFDGGPLLVIADGQTRGRGRRGADWLTAPRAVACSLAVRIEWPTARLPLVPLIAGLAMAEQWPDVAIKWPNDLMIGDDKVGGFLTEAAGADLVIGMGLNLWWPGAPDGCAARFEFEPPPGTAGEVAERWARHTLERLGAGPDNWGHDDYTARSYLLGAAVQWEPDGAGIARAIDDDGALLVEVAGELKRIVSGAVRKIRPARREL